MPTTVLVAAGAYLPDEIDGPVAVVVRDARIEAITREVDVAAESADNVVDVGNFHVAPGFVDIHTHGFRGRDVTTGSEADLVAMADALPGTGVTAFLPTVASTGPEETRRQVERIASVMKRNPRGAQVIGVRLEGPFISRVKKGAQHEAAIRPSDPNEMVHLTRLGPIRMVDFAPEEDTDFALLHRLVEHGIVASIGHTAASYDQTLAAINAGARHCTHLFNAMSPLEHRSPGVAGALLTDKRATVEVIADGVHVHPAMLRLVVKARRSSEVALVTDAISAAGLGEGTYTFVGRQVTVDNGAVRLEDGTLAGSVLTMDQAVRNAVNLVGVGWPDAVRMATLTPATIAGVSERKGRLAPGADADLVVLDERGVVHATWCRGQRVYVSRSG